MTAQLDTNPNRPTPPEYCANCGSSASCRRYRLTETLDQCSNQHPRPITLAEHQQATRRATVQAMTLDEARHFLDLFTYHSPESFDRFAHINGF